MKELYQIGIPVEKLSTVFMLWASYERPCIIAVNPAKTDDWAVIEFRHTELAADIVGTIKDSKLKVLEVPVKSINI